MASSLFVHGLNVLLSVVSLKSLGLFCAWLVLELTIAVIDPFYYCNAEWLRMHIKGYISACLQANKVSCTLCAPDTNYKALSEI